MSLEFCTLASGSSGNCCVIRTPDRRAILIDAGIGPRITAKRLCDTGVTIADIAAIVLTHLDRDHFSPTWASTIISRSINVYCHESRLAPLLEIIALYGADPEQLEQIQRFIQPFRSDEPFSPLDGVQARPIRLAHDHNGSHGFVFDGFGCRIGYATDLGVVPRELIDLFCDVDLLALESNYDPEMQLSSSRPWFLKHRIMGGAGHLSNEQALGAIRQILDRCQRELRRMPGHIVLLHRSRQCNCPNLVRSIFGRDERIAARLTLAEQYQRSEWLRARSVAPAAGEQLALAWE
jgi:phosphoribosyl 1,2-cyclic phosphodiesterase